MRPRGARTALGIGAGIAAGVVALLAGGAEAQLRTEPYSWRSGQGITGAYRDAYLAGRGGTRPDAIARDGAGTLMMVERESGGGAAARTAARTAAPLRIMETGLCPAARSTPIDAWITQLDSLGRD